MVIDSGARLLLKLGYFGALERPSFPQHDPERHRGGKVGSEQQQRIERRLAAIFFAADVAGYSRLIRQDEAGTLRALAAARELRACLRRRFPWARLRDS